MLDILDPALTSDRQREVLRELLGLRGRLTDIGSSEAPTMADIGHRLGISRERVRQLRGQIAERIASDPACRRWLEERGHGLQGRV
jgi:DNA-directed RNA polymerase sigma subunit (sigma70/sigma32)